MDVIEPAFSVKPIVFGQTGPYQVGASWMREYTLKLGERNLNCAVGPKNGPPLVLLHGVTRCWLDFNSLLPALTEQWQVFALDHRGHGKSGWRTPPYRVVDFTADALTLVEKHLPGPAILIGHSLGALVAALIASKLPERVRALVLEDPPGTTLGDGIDRSRFHLQFANTAQLLTKVHDVGGLTDELAQMQVQRPRDGTLVRFSELRELNTIRFGAECLLKMDPAVLTTLLEGRWLEGLDWFGSLSKIECPSLLLRADPACGGMLDPAEANRITTLVSRCERVDLLGVGHSIHSIKPDQTSALVTNFLKKNKL